MAVHLHVAERTDALADGLADLLATPLADPFAREVVVVPARGVERWLTQRLSHRLGVGGRGGTVSAPGSTSSPPTRSSSMLLGKDADDPWDPDRLAWPLLERHRRRHGRAPGFDDLSTHLGGGDPDDDRSTRRYAVARRLAGLFASYAVQRPDADHRLALRAATPTGPGASSTPTCAGRRSCGADCSAGSARRRPTSGSPTRSSALRSRGRRPRPAAAAVALRPHPAARDRGRAAATRWATCARCTSGCRRPPPTCGTRSRRRRAAGQVPRAADESADLVGHPLLGSLGRDSRELRRTLGGVPSARSRGPRRRHPTPCSAGSSTTCAPTPRPTPRPGPRRTTRRDASVQVHACHGSARQVDVLREVLVGLLQDDPTLEPRDILVMCPDIETYAPLISAGFGLADVAVEGAGHPATPAAGAAGRPVARRPPTRCSASPPQLVELVRGRLTATQVLDLAGAEPVRARFGFGDDDLERIAHWVDRAGHPLGLRRRPPQQRSASAASGGQHLGDRHAPGAAGRRDVRARPPAGRPAPCPSTT